MENFLNELNPQQIEAVQALDGPLLVVAGAGSGKTRVLTCRIANLLSKGVKPYNILAITFTNKAADEMKSRAESLIGEPARSVWISTFHSFCARVLRREIEVTGLFKKNYTIYDTGDCKVILNECIKKLGLDPDRFIVAASTISSAKNKLIDAAHYREYILMKEQTTDLEKNIANIYELYERRLIENNALDFDDLLFLMVRIFREHPDILEKYQEQFLYILIDEYQDTNFAQYTLTKMLADKHRNIFVVGDADQSIYGFRGADMQNILNFERDYPEAKVIKLEQNYRSTRQILTAANSVISHNVNRVDKTLWTQNPEGSKINFIHCMSDRSEAAFIAREIRRLIARENFQYKDMAILYRTNAQSRVLEEKFMQTDIPYIIVGGTRFYDRKEVKDAIAYLRLILNPRDDLSFLRVINVPRRGIGPINLERLRSFANEKDISIFDVVVTGNGNMLEQVPNLSPKCKQKLREFALMVIYYSSRQSSTPLVDMVKDVLTQSGYVDYLKEVEETQKPDNVSRVENINSFINGAVEFAEANPGSLLEDFMNHIALISDVDALTDAESRVSMMTVHSAKGLEFPVVFIAGMEEGLMPHSNSMISSLMLEEERRICYVAMTRAQKLLYITSASERKAFGRSYDSQISRFLNEIPQDILLSVSEKSSSLNPNFRQSVEASKSSSQKTAAITELSKETNQAQPPSKPEPVDWKVGDRLSHRKWGIGTVMEVKGENITVSFVNPEIGQKLIKSTIAPIEKV